MVGEDRICDQIVDELLRSILVHRDLLEHDLAFGIELRERGRKDHVTHDVHRDCEVMIRDARVDERVLARGGGVQLAAEPVEDLRNLERAEALAAFEQEMLDEVRHAGLVALLVPGAGADPVADRSRAHVIEPLRDDAFSRVELGQPPVLHARSVVRETVEPAIRRESRLSASIDDVALRVGVEAWFDSREGEQRGEPEAGADAAEERRQCRSGRDGDRGQDRDPDRARQHRPERLPPPWGDARFSGKSERLDVGLDEPTSGVVEDQERDPERTDHEGE